MKRIEMIIADKIATVVGSPYIVCGNDNYVIDFAFDSEWDGEIQKTARFKFSKNGEAMFEDVTFNGTVCPVPMFSDITEVYVGVYGGDLTTTTPAMIECRKSILCGDGTHEMPSEDVYSQLIEAINTGLVKGEKGDAGEQGVSGIYVGSGEMPESYNIQIDPEGDASADVLIQEALLKYIYPVGSYYWSSKDTNPSVLFGGTWEQVKDKFIFAAGDSYAAGETGGKASQTIGIENLPANILTNGKTSSAQTGALLATVGGTAQLWYASNDAKALDTMPPYEVAYCWKRIA